MYPVEFEPVIPCHALDRVATVSGHSRVCIW